VSLADRCGTIQLQPRMNANGRQYNQGRWQFSEQGRGSPSGESRGIDQTANEPAALACIRVHSRFLVLSHSRGQRLARRQGRRRRGGGRDTGFGCGWRDGREWAQNVDSRIASGGGLWCRIHVMNGFEVLFGYQREGGPVGPLTQRLHDILTPVGAGISAFAGNVVDPAWLSLRRYVSFAPLPPCVSLGTS
jgi:hypothetical protein